MEHALVAITDYCERIDDSFWAEPLNAATNLVFLFAAAAQIRALRQSAEPIRRLWDLWALTGLLAAIGIGSFLWHTFATAWAELADVIPILLFLSLFLLSFLLRVIKTRPVWALFWFILFQTVNTLLQWMLPGDLFNGSIFYLPAWASLLAITLYCRLTRLGCSRRLLYAMLLFTLSLTFRTLDQSLCAVWPYGTHFIWHLLNGLTLYLVMGVLPPNRRTADPLHADVR
ncbi:MAG: ceramidase domain-containing protein [Candidatus Thiodiazotropha sp.]